MISDVRHSVYMPMCTYINVHVKIPPTHSFGAQSSVAGQNGFYRISDTMTKCTEPPLHSFQVHNVTMVLTSHIS